MVEHGGSLDELVRAIDAADPAMGRHGRGATRLAIRVATAIDPVLAASSAFRLGCLLHDAGKLAIPADVLSKPGRLSESEWELMRRHPALGARMCELAGAPPQTTEIVRHHHERFDGLGYPDRLSAEQIPLAARVLAVCDAFDAMISDRPYRASPLSRHEALERIHAGRGTQFDATVVDALLHHTWRPRNFDRLAPLRTDMPAAVAC